MSDSHQTIVIIGSGPAGLTAAIYTARAELNPLVIEGEPSSTGDQPGGQLMLTTEVENFPGFPDGILGPQLMADMKAQAERFGATFLTRKVTKVDLTKKPFEIWIDNPDKDLPTHTADALIISTGAQSVMLEVEGEKLGELQDSPLLIGMMSAGAEEKMFKKYSSESPGLRPGGSPSSPRDQ